MVENDPYDQKIKIFTESYEAVQGHRFSHYPCGQEKMFDLAKGKARLLSYKEVFL